MNVVCAGDCGVDRFSPSGQDRAGGITLNFALRARAAFPPDARIRVVAPLGDDDAAALVRGRVAGSGLECHFRVLAGRTPVQHIGIDEAGERHFTRYEAGVLADWRAGNLERCLVADADLRVLPAFDQNRAAFESLLALPTAGRTAVDFADFAAHPDLGFVRRHGAAIDVAFFGLDADRQDLVDALEALAASLGLLVVVTLGAAGSLAFEGERRHSAAAVPVDRIVDTTGAGDAFAAAFLGRYCRDADVDAALGAGARLAAKAVAAFGGN